MYNIDMKLGLVSAYSHNNVHQKIEIENIGAL